MSLTLHTAWCCSGFTFRGPSLVSKEPIMSMQKKQPISRKASQSEARKAGVKDRVFVLEEGVTKFF